MTDASNGRPAIPASVSHRQLQTWLQRARPDQPSPGEDAAPANDNTPANDTEWEALLATWMGASQALLGHLSRAPERAGAGRSPRQVMALGALQAHLVMALQAASASRGRRHG
ncbi:MAG: hypothetical protein VKM01_05400 [Cyanobacteriota bacterium]|nr:hypothetical protein [Cyanobacteriota bacterium]